MTHNSKFRPSLLLLLLVIVSGIAVAQPPKNAEVQKQVVEKFFFSVEQQKFDVIKEIFAADAQGILPFAPKGYPNHLDGAEGIYKQFSGLTAFFSSMKFPRQILATEDPNLIFVKFAGNMDFKTGGKYENEYLATFKFKDGKIIEYIEYFNPIVLANSFNIPLCSSTQK